MSSHRKIIPLLPRTYYQGYNATTNLTDISNEYEKVSQAHKSELINLNTHIKSLEDKLTSSMKRLNDNAGTLSKCASKLNTDASIKKDYESKLVKLNEENNKYVSIIDQYKDYIKQHEKLQQQQHQQQQQQQQQQHQQQQHQQHQQPNQQQQKGGYNSYKRKRKHIEDNNNNFLSNIYSDEDEEDTHIRKNKTNSTYKNMYNY